MIRHSDTWVTGHPDGFSGRLEMLEALKAVTRDFAALLDSDYSTAERRRPDERDVSIVAARALIRRIEGDGKCAACGGSGQVSPRVGDGDVVLDVLLDCDACKGTGKATT